MAVLVLCLFAALAAGLVAIYARLSPLRALQDERTARQGMHEGRGKALVTEREDLFKGLRSQIKELTETVYLERGIANERQGQLEVERAASHALVAQLNEERLVVEGICLEVNAERVDLKDALYRALGRDRVNRAVEEIRARRARGESTSAQGVKPPARAGEEETTREGPPRRPATPAREHGAGVQKEPAPSKELVAPAGEEQMQSARPTTLPTTLEALAEQRELVATTAAGDMDAEGDEATRAMSSSAVAQALQADAGGAEEGDNDPTLSLSRLAVDEALGAGAGGTARSPQTPPRAVRAGAVAPPASAPPLLPPEPDDQFATFNSLPLFDPEHTTTSGEPPRTLALDPPLYAPRGRSTEEAQHGLDGVPETVPGRRLEPHEETPRRPRGVEHEART